MDLTLQRQRRNDRPLPAALVPAASLIGAAGLSAGLLVVLSFVAARLG